MKGEELFRIVLNMFDETGAWVGDEEIGDDFTTLEAAQKRLAGDGFAPIDPSAPRCKTWINGNVRAKIHNRPEYLIYLAGRN